ncbi:chromatin structure-remodeling complex SYD-like isoform X1 [Chlorella sorokiniana]|uniref:Chromatin structure-remodeling complex SYD-like isoform X1 n=1 Tax=Chlorella sorokiniana TaxID=3076 RepID=A0A2P6TX88_CHLSO|nr:chromatin structure-remodeling complex SYD-like isoform X1 [Chlorella sorokiniana]|eukprot:PRW58677.1 chromatin structure-remodeling complex SYD-like isoform X1 [Chlorella sorokiniana]
MQAAVERPGGRSNTASLLEDLARLLPASSGQEGLQRVLARSHLMARPGPSSVATHKQQCCSSKTTALLGSLLNKAGGTPLPPGAENSIDQQPGGRYLRLLQACMLADVAQQFGKAARRQPPAPPALTTPPCDYLASVGRSVAALHGGAQPALELDSPTADQPANAATAAPAAPTSTAAAQVRQALHEEREVTAELTPNPADPAACSLHLRVLAPARTQAALAAKLGSPAARRQVRLRRRLQGDQVHRAVCAALRYAERAALQAPLLAAQRSSPKPNALVALGRVLRGSQGPAAEVVAERAAAEQRRAVLGAAVLAQHKEMKKAWREKRKREAAERMEALKASDMNEYMRLMAGKRHGKIDELLSQTDGCLRQLAARLRTAGVGTALLATAAAGGSPTLSGSPQVPSAPASSAAVGDGIAAPEQSHEAWNQLATAIQAGGVEQPELLTGGELREYQLRGLRWMVGLHRHGLNGILADEMGLGKTIQVIALACHLVCEAQAAGGRQPRPFLIAVPASVLPNWEAELAHWAPSLKVVCYRGDVEAREEVWTRQLRSGRGGGAGGGTHVVLTTYDFLMNKNDKPRLSRVHWGYLVVDEGHRLKNAGCKLNAELKGYRTDHRLLLTGTPLQASKWVWVGGWVGRNNLSELWSLLNFLLPDLFSSGEDFQAWFGGAERRGAACGAAAADGDSSDDEGAAELEARMLSEEEALIVLRPFMLRRLKETVASELPQKREHVLRGKCWSGVQGRGAVVPSAYQQGLFRLMQRDLQGWSGLKGVNNVLMEMRNICNHPLISRMHPEGAELALPAHPLPAEVRLCSKLELLDRCLVKLRAGGHKVLLFCTMTRALDVVEDYLAWRGFPALRLDGNTGAGERGDLVRRFNDPDGGAFVFLLSIRAGGVGLNLQGADTVVMFDTDWNPQMDLQAQARAHRMGQTKEVLVLRFVTAGTVEERVVGVSAVKAALADRSITGGFFDGKTSAEERQRYLLETIRTSTQRGGSGASGSTDGQLSDSQLNEMLARGEGEVELFEAEDARMQAGEEAAWRASLGSAAAAMAAAGTPYSRLACEAEVAPLVAQAQQLLQPKKDPDEGALRGAFAVVCRS